MSVKVQAAYRDALLRFSARNDGVLPESVLVYRASAREEDWSAMRETEVEAILRVQQAVTSGGNKYEPDLTFVAVARHVAMRFFSTNGSANAEQKTKNPEPGTVVDDPLVNRPDMLNFFLVNQAVTKGTARPTHYSVLYDSGEMTPTALQSLTYRLSFLYFNHTGSVCMPAPAQYAKKIAHFVGTAVRETPHERLLGSLFYL